jgi:hypothetical protein
MVDEYAGRVFDGLPERAAGERGFWGHGSKTRGFTGSVGTNWIPG